MASAHAGALAPGPSKDFSSSPFSSGSFDGGEENVLKYKSTLPQNSNVGSNEIITLILHTGVAHHSGPTLTTAPCKDCASRDITEKETKR